MVNSVSCRRQFRYLIDGPEWPHFASPGRDSWSVRDPVDWHASLLANKHSQVRNEIQVLKKVSQGHKNIVTLWDYFEVSIVFSRIFCIFCVVHGMLPDSLLWHSIWSGLRYLMSRLVLRWWLWFFFSVDRPSCLLLPLSIPRHSSLSGDGSLLWRRTFRSNLRKGVILWAWRMPPRPSRDRCGWLSTRSRDRSSWYV